MGGLATAGEQAAVVGDYSRETPTMIAPHDLVWFGVDALADDTPGWARAIVAAGQPAVVRRAPRDGTRLPIGIRGPTRGDRHAAWIAGSAITARLAPQALLDGPAGCPPSAERRAAIPAFTALAALVAARDAGHIPVFGVTGALGYELATGQPAARVGSDLDLVVRWPLRDAARLDRLATVLDRTVAAHGVRIDAQLETPAGGVALAEWRGGATRVLVKSDTGPFLVADPWSVSREVS